MFSRYRSSGPIPCLKCNGTELKLLHDHFKNSDGEFWVYKIPTQNCCRKCDFRNKKGLWTSYPMIRSFCCESPYEFVQVPVPVGTVGTIERAIHASSVATKGSDFRAHGTFISHLSLLDCTETYKQALCCWVPKAMMDFANDNPGVERMLRTGRLQKPAEISPPPGLPEPKIDKIANLVLPPANPDCENGMSATNVDPDAYGKEERIKGDSIQIEPSILAHQIGPDLIPTEVFESSGNNLKAGAAKRVQPLPFKADQDMIKKIGRTVNALMDHVFSSEKIKAWREKNPDVDEFKSSKWDSDRWRTAFEEALSDTAARIEQTFQIKNNEALPAKGKAPRPIIQCGDRAQIMMSLPVKCFEELLFEHFEMASIKHIDKLGAMQRIAKHLAQPNANIVEGDGSAWDACCNLRIRELTENRIIKHIIAVLGEDPQIPASWMKKVLDDMEKPKLKGKAKVRDFSISPIRVCIDSIRQSGHRGTSCFNYLINLVCWLCVLAKEPWKLIPKHGENLRCNYTSPRDGQRYVLKYAFEGDDSAISTTENLSSHSEAIEQIWTSMGFRMKLVYVDEKMTFTGYDFLVGKNGPTGTVIPEVIRNFCSSSWTTSSLVKSFPHRKNEVGAAAMLARAINFKQCGPISRYFAALGLAHSEKCGDQGLDESQAKALGIAVSQSVVTDLQELFDCAEVMTDDVRKLVNLVVPFSKEQELRMLAVDFGSNPYDLMLARQVVPFEIWDPAQFNSPRRQ